MKIFLITGFLGAGKTTILKRMLATHHATHRFGVVVNDLSDLEVDGELIRLGHAVSEADGTLVSLHGGSISDQRRDDLRSAIAQLAGRGVSHLLVETSGGSEPEAVIEILKSQPDAELHGVVSLVDARMLLHDYEGGPGLVRVLIHNEKSGRQTSEDLLFRQLQVAGMIILTKLDLVPEESLPLILQTLQVLNPGASLVGCAYGNIDFSLILDAPPHDRSVASNKALALSPEEEIGTTLIQDARPLHPLRFHQLYREKLGTGLFRSKGFSWFASRPDQVLLWNQAGGAMGLELVGIWKAHILATDTRLLSEEREWLEEHLKNRDPDFGDRGCELTLIGKERDRRIFAAGLMECFCTDSEIEEWKQGKAFADPWPSNLKTAP